MSYAVDFTDVSTVGVESSPVAEALAGLRGTIRGSHFVIKHEH